MATISLYQDTDKQHVDISATVDGFHGVYVSMRQDKFTIIAGLTLTNAEALELASQLEALVQRNGGVL